MPEMAILPLLVTIWHSKQLLEINSNKTFQGSFQAPPVQQQSSPPMSANDPNDPMEAIQASQTDIVNFIQTKISDLKLSSLSTDYVEGYDAPGSSNIAWLANVRVPQAVASITVFHGPLTNVPHIVDRVEFENGNLRWYCDVRPRAYGAYETRDATTGEYPGPEVLGRKAFEYSGARNEFTTKFGDVAYLLEMNQFEGAIALPMDTSEAAVLTTGPLVVNIQFPATEVNVQTLLRVRQSVAEAWLRWSTEEQHDHRPGAPINSQYVYDAKFRQNAFLALRNVYNRMFDPNQAQTLAIAESGPLDEAYVGGGS